MPAYAGATLFLSGVEYVARANSLLRTGVAYAPASAAHPSPGERKAMLWLALQQSGDQPVIDYASRLGLALYAALAALWAVVEPPLERATGSASRRSAGSRRSSTRRWRCSMPCCARAA